MSDEMAVQVAAELLQPRSGSAFQPRLRVLIGVFGGASFAGGVAAVFLTANGTGTGVLITFGGILLVLAMLGDRIESLEFGGGKLKMRAAAAEKFALAADSEDRGDAETAARLRAEAKALLIASEYRNVRVSMPEGLERTRAMERIMVSARELAAQGTFQPSVVIGWLRADSADQRITAIAMMQAQPALRDFDAVLAAVNDPKSAFEQYHAMILVKQMLGDLSAEQQQSLAKVLKDEKSLRFPYDRGRRRLSEEILNGLAARVGNLTGKRGGVCSFVSEEDIPKSCVTVPRMHLRRPPERCYMRMACLTLASCRSSRKSAYPQR